MTECCIFDLDGTLANVTHRLPLIKGPKKDWNAFFDACVHDTPNSYVVRLNHILFSTMTVIISSGRPDSHNDQTVKWLMDNDVRYHILMMRKAKDFREDTIVKREMLARIRIELGFKPVFAIDDRPSVVDMWRENGVPCFAVDQTEWVK